MSKLLEIVDKISILEKALIKQDIEKAWVKKPIGTEVTRKDGKKYRKIAETGNEKADWVEVKDKVTDPKVKENNDKQPKTDEEGKPSFSKKELTEHAKNTSEDALNNAIKHSSDPNIRQSAHEELDRRSKEEHIQENDKKIDKKEYDIEDLKKQYKEAFENDDFDKLQEISKKLAENANKNKGEIDQSKYSDKRFTQNFTEEEKDHLDTYASIKYKEINSQMREGKVSKENQKIIDSILSSMNKNKLKEDVIVYRGVGGHYDKSNKNSFTSTSTDKEVAKNFARGENSEVREIKVPKGTPVAYMGGAERELILPPNWDKDTEKQIKKSFESWL